jgi:peptide/nickel transport system permease protein
VAAFLPLGARLTLPRDRTEGRGGSLTRLIAIKLVMLVPVVFLVGVGTFAMVELLPGDASLAILGENARPELIERVREEYGFDRPVVVRYLDWVGDALHGDFGRSLRTNQPVAEALRERLPVTLQLAVMAQVMALGLAIPLGAWSAWRARGRIDRATTTASYAIASLPSFVVAIILVWSFALQWEVFPVSGFSRLTNGLGANLEHAFLPALTLALGEFAVYSQLLRSDMSATLNEEFIVAARARGLPARHVLVHEALRPSSFALLTLAGVNLGRLIGGTIIVEYFFGLGGVGTLVVQAVSNRDFPVLQGSVFILAVGYLLINTAVDLAYNYLDPRIRRG